MGIVLAKTVEALVGAVVSKARNGKPNGASPSPSRLSIEEHHMLRSLHEWRDKKDGEDKVFHKELLDKTGAIAECQHDTCNILERIANKLGT